MQIFSKDLINKIMLYVAHPCADIIHSALQTKGDTRLVLETKIKLTPTIDYYTSNTFYVEDETTEEHEQYYE
jgi:hypothetical protein